MRNGEIYFFKNQFASPALKIGKIKKFLDCIPKKTVFYIGKIALESLHFLKSINPFFFIFSSAVLIMRIYSIISFMLSTTEFISSSAAFSIKSQFL